jgi:penicillin amidase
MDRDLTRRGLLGAIVGGGVAAGTLTPVASYLRRFVPLSGTAWRSATDGQSGTVESPYGSATVAYDDYGVPHIESDDEAALYFAVGYVHAADRLFQLDLQRRLMRGELSAMVGEAALDSDEFHVRMDFVGGAEVTWNHLKETAAETGTLVEAYADGVNTYIENETLPIEFGLLEYEPDLWTPVDTILMEKQISWTLTGSFRTLRLAHVREAFDTAVNELYPARLDHNSPIIRDGNGGTVKSNTHRTREYSDGMDAPDSSLVDWLRQFESPPGIGSNSWVVAGEYTDSKPVVANDPHLSLMAPPVWYEQRLRAPDYAARGVTFPGVPFVVIGETDTSAWGFTNVGADVIDFYRYDIEGERYRYRGEWRALDTEKVTIEVANGEDQTITRRKTVHGPLLEREGSHVGVAWTGHTATETTLAIHEYAKSSGLDDFLAATRKFDEPTQNLVYADIDGNTLYYVTGRIPIRTVDGEEVWGNRIFDGSTGEGEWKGFEPFGVSSWDGFIPFEEKPHVTNPGYIGTANQRVVDDPEHYLAEAYSDPYRGIRIYDLLDQRAASDQPIDAAYVQEMQADTYDGRTENLVDALVQAAAGHDDLATYADDLREWDGRMDRASTGALLFAHFFDAYKRELFESLFEESGLDESYFPSDWVVQHLNPDSEWFGERSRNEVLIATLETAVETIESEGYETFGDYNTTAAITHPFDLSFLNYPDYPTDGSRETMNNYAVERPTGSSWRMVATPGGESVGVIPGGNSGEYFSEHYADQLRMWADVEYHSLSWNPGDTAIRFEEEKQ